MDIAELNKIIHDIEEILEINTKFTINMNKKMSIKIEETFPNVNPDVPNPLHHLNDVKISFFFFNNLYDVYMLSEMSILDFFRSVERIFTSTYFDIVKTQKNNYNLFKIKEMRHYNINKLME